MTSLLQTASSFSFEKYYSPFDEKQVSNNNTSVIYPEYTDELIIPVKDGYRIHIQGIANEGNTCYANALFQGLASTNAFREYLKTSLGDINEIDNNNNNNKNKKKKKKKKKHDKKINKYDNNMEHNMDTTKSLYEILKQLETKVKKDDVESTNSMFNNIFGSQNNNINTDYCITDRIEKKHVKQFLKNFKKFDFKVHQQNDSFELLQGIFEILDDLEQQAMKDNVKKYIKKKSQEDNNDNDNNKEKGNDYQSVNPLGINEVDIRQCSNCNNITSDKLQPSCYLSVDLNNNKMNFSMKNFVGGNLPKNVDDCLGQYFAKESIEGYQCDKCKTIANVSKYRRLASTPTILTVHFNRRMGSHIITDKIEFDKTILKLKDEWMIDSLKNNNNNNNKIKKRYRLKSIIKHIPFTSGGGHYISYRYVCDGIKSRWIEANDDSLKEIDFNDDIKECVAYMAFYERVDR